MSAVAFEIDEVVLPTGVIVANISTIAFKSVKCLGTEGSSGLAVTLFRAGTDSVNIAQDLIAVVWYGIGVQMLPLLWIAGDL